MADQDSAETGLPDRQADSPSATHEGASAPRKRRRGQESGRHGARLGARRVGLSTVVAAAVAVAVAFAAGWGPFDRSDWGGEGQGSTRVRVFKGDSGAVIGRALVKANVVRTVKAFVRAAAADPRKAARIQPGLYDMHIHMSAAAALDRFFDPAARVQMIVQVPDGKRASRILASIADQTGLSLDSLNAAAKAQAATLPDYAQGQIEGFLYPATYAFDPTASAAEVIRTITSTAVAKHKALGVLNPPRSLHLTPREVLTLASILQVEAYPDDYAKVARVVFNRISQGRRLQLDSTLNYALGTSKWTFTAAEHADPSAYNTFAHEGLPPGPIGNPGKAAIAAAMNPASGNWIYFVTTNPDTGLTEFASTESGFNALRQKFRAWLKAQK